MGKAKSLQELTLLDRFLFSVVMEDNETLEDVLEIILGYPVPLKDKAQAEKELRRTPLTERMLMEISEELIQLLHYFERTTGEIAADSHSEKIEKLQKQVEQVKMSEEVGIRFMNAFEEKMMERREGREEGLAEGRKEGLAEGQSAKQEEIACKMLEKGLDFTLIAEMTGLSEKDLKALQKQG